MRPFVHINFALDERGWHCSAGGARLQISCDADWRRVHGLRERYDAVAVGARTWNIDCPSLNVRAERLGRNPRRQPARVVFAGHHRCETGESGPPTYLIAETSAQAPRTTVIETSGHELGLPLAALRRAGIRSMLVEGGPALIESFLRQGCFDQITVFVRGATCHRASVLAADALHALPSPMKAESLGEGVLLAYARNYALQPPALAFQETA